MSRSEATRDASQRARPSRSLLEFLRFGFAVVAVALSAAAFAILFRVLLGLVFVRALRASDVVHAIADVCDESLQRLEPGADATVDDIVAADARARRIASLVIEGLPS